MLLANWGLFCLHCLLWLTLLFVMKVMFWHLMNDSHKFMTALFVILFWKRCYGDFSSIPLMYLSIVIIAGSLIFSAEYLIVMGKKQTVEVCEKRPWFLLNVSWTCHVLGSRGHVHCCLIFRSHDLYLHWIICFHLHGYHVGELLPWHCFGGGWIELIGCCVSACESREEKVRYWFFSMVSID